MIHRIRGKMIPAFGNYNSKHKRKRPAMVVKLPQELETFHLVCKTVVQKASSYGAEFPLLSH